VVLKSRSMRDIADFGVRGRAMAREDAVPRPGLRSQAPRRLDAIHVGHLQVEHDKVGIEGGCDRQGLAPAVGKANVASQEVEKEPERLGSIVVVIDHQHSGPGVFDSLSKDALTVKAIDKVCSCVRRVCRTNPHLRKAPPS
jgi:hypothetical protein